MVRCKTDFVTHTLLVSNLEGVIAAKVSSGFCASYKLIDVLKLGLHVLYT